MLPYSLIPKLTLILYVLAMLMILICSYLVLLRERFKESEFRYPEGLTTCSLKMFLFTCFLLVF